MNASAAAANLPVGWSKRRLFDLCQFIPGKAHEPFIDPLGEFICVNSKFISTEGDVAKFCNQNITPARTDDVLLVMSDLPNGRALAKCYLVEQDELYAVNQRVCILRPRPSADPKMLFHVLNRNPYFLAFNDGVNQTHLLNSVFEKCELAVPDDSVEQTRIGSALSDADALIEGLERLIAKKRLIKQGAMQDLLTAKRRLPGFSGEWVERKLGDFGKCLRGVSYDGQADLSATDTPSTVRLLRANNVQDGQIVYSDMQFVNSARVRNHQILQDGDMLICMANGSRALVGKSAKFSGPDEMAYTFGAFMGAFRMTSDACSGRYVAHLLKSDRYRRLLGVILSGSAINNLAPSQIENFEFSFAVDNLEQEAISDVLDDMDAEIQALDTRLEKARQVKEGMMQNLLTGRIRLV